MELEMLEACYKILRLTPDAKFNEMKYAYRTLVQRWHPGRFATDAARQRQTLEHVHAVTQAYAMFRAYRAVADLSYAQGGWRCQGVRALAWGDHTCMPKRGALSDGTFGLTLLSRYNYYH